MHRNTSDVVRTGFADAFGFNPAGIWSAPGRISLMGDHTDIQDGITYGFAYSARSAVALAPRTDRLIRIRTDLVNEAIDVELDDIAPPAAQAWQDYPLGLLWVIRNWLPDHDFADDRPTPQLTGLDMFITTDVPIGAGLASSASLCAALSTALNELWNLDQTPMRLARFGYEVENNYIGASSGMSDHVTVLLAEEHHDVFYDARGGDATTIDVDPLAAHGYVGVVVESGESHRNWAGQVNDRHAACRRVAEQLGYQTLREVSLEELEAAREQLDETDYRRARYIVTEIQRVLDFTRLNRTEGLPSVLPLFNQSQQSIRDDFEVSTQRIDLICEIAAAIGAPAARMTGSGFGGAVFVIVAQSDYDRLEATLREAFTEYGWDGLQVYPAVKTGAARRDA